MKHSGSDFRLMTNKTVIGGSVADVCHWLDPPWLNWGFTLALTLCELRALFFISSQYVYKLDCLPVMIHWIDTLAK